MSELCVFVGDHFAASILPHPTVAKELVTANFRASTLEEALSLLGFLTGRQIRTEGIHHLLGGEGEETVAVFPSAELGDNSRIFGDSPVSKVGRSLVVRGDKATLTDAERVIGEIEAREDAREVLNLRLVVVEVAESENEPFGQWLRSAELLSDGAVAWNLSTSAGSVVDAAAQLGGSVSALVEFVEGLRKSDVSVDTVCSLPDGERMELVAGQVVEREVNESVPGETDTRYRTGFDEKNIGFSLKMQPKRLRSGWSLGVEVADSSLIDAQEFRTEYTGETLIRDGARGLFVLADLERRGSSYLDQRPNLRALSFLKRGQRRRDARRILLCVELVGPLTVSSVSPALRAVPLK